VNARAAVLLILIGCVSGGDPNSAGRPGAAITVDVVDLENPSMPVDTQGSRNYIIHVEVSNNSDQVQTVRQIVVDQIPGDYAVEIDSSVRAFDEMIDPGKDHEFPITVQGRPTRSVRGQNTGNIGFRVGVTLANRDFYYYTFKGSVP
jgi:hypothetical protein